MRIRGYFSKPKGVREQNRLGNAALYRCHRNNLIHKKDLHVNNILPLRLYVTRFTPSNSYLSVVILRSVKKRTAATLGTELTFEECYYVAL